MDTREYDLVVLGGGPAGEKGAAQAAYFGKKVAVVEREQHCGGAATNTGTLPSKTLRETSLMLSGLRARDLYGVDLSLRREATAEDFLHRERRVVERERQRILDNLQRHDIDAYRGTGSFVDPHSVRVESPGLEPVHLRGDVILICTGSSPRRPDMYPFDDPRVHDSESILHLSQMPTSLVVIGGGVIGSEYACTFAALDIEVTLIDRNEILLDFLDREVSLALMDRMRKNGIDLVRDGVEKCAARPEAIEVQLTSGRSIRADGLLVAAGRVSDVGLLNLEAAGITPGEWGLVEVSDRYRTEVPHIYAVGDVVGFPALASTSMEQARVAVVDAFDLEYKKAVAPVLPFGIYSIPEVSMVGATEEELQKKGIPYVVGKASYGENPRGVIIGDSEGFLKLIYALDDMRLLGVHVIGEIATEIVHIGLMALMNEAHSDVFIRTCFNYPTLGDLYKYATYDAMGTRQRKRKAGR